MTRRRMLQLFCLFVAVHPSCRCCPEGSCRWAWETCPSCSFGFGRFALAPSETATAPGELPASTTEPRVTSPAAAPPTALVGGTLAFAPTPSGTFALASIPEDDRMHVVRVDATDNRVALLTHGDVALERGDEPGRVIADATRGVAYVALRGSGAIVTIDPTTASVLERRHVCSAPRGLALDRDALHVACTSGDVVTLSLASGGETKRTFVARGLEEIAVYGDELLAGDGSRLFVVEPDAFVRSGDATRGSMGPLRTTDAWNPSVALAISNVATEFVLVSPEGTIGPSISVRDNPMPPSDMAVSRAGVVVVAGGVAFLLGPGESNFARIVTPGIASAVALSEGKIIALQTRDPETILFLDSHAGVVAREPLSRP